MNRYYIIFLTYLVQFLIKNYLKMFSETYFMQMKLLFLQGKITSYFSFKLK